MTIMELSLLLLTSIVAIFIFFASKPKTQFDSQSYPVIGNLPGFLRNRHRFHDWVADMLAEAPTSTLRVRSILGLSDGVCTADPENIRHILSTNFVNYVKGDRFHSVLRELIGDGIFNADGHLWSVQRKIASREFSTKSLKSFVSDLVADEISGRLLPCLRRPADENRVVDLNSILTKFTFDNVCKLAFGVDPCCLSSGGSDGETRNASFGRAFEYAVEVCWSRFLSPAPIVWKAKRFFNLGSERRFREAITVIDEFAAGIINSRLNKDAGDRDSPDLLSRFAGIDDDDLGLPDLEGKRKFLRDIIISFVLAGRDSTSTALTWFFWLISGHPRCAEAILAELSPAPGNNFGYDELKNMHYLRAAISESMRLFPPVAIDSRMVLNDDVLPDGTRVLAGWFADYSAYGVGRMERVWGPDCREFKPERWLAGGDGLPEFQMPDPFRFPVFHCGPRMCLGKDMAYVQMKSIAAAVMSEFEVLAVDGGGTPERMAEPPYEVSLLLKMKGGLPVRLKRREL